MQRLLFVIVLLTSPVFAETPTAARQEALRELLLEDCGSCHGMTLKGGLGPSLISSRLQPYQDQFLIETILEGRPGTPMPAWKTLLGRDEAAWIVQELRRRPDPS
jgi:cytochrome c55X